MTSQSTRATLAAALVGGALLACAVCAAIPDRPGAGAGSRSPAPALLDAAQEQDVAQRPLWDRVVPADLWGERDASDFPASLYAKLAGVEGLRNGASAQMEAEVTGGLQGVAHMASTDDTVGIVFEGGRDAAAGKVSACLADHGWSPVSRDSLGLGGTFAKDEGRYRWLFMHVAQVDDAATVVISLQEGPQ